MIRLRGYEVAPGSRLERMAREVAYWRDAWGQAWADGYLQAAIVASATEAAASRPLFEPFRTHDVTARAAVRRPRDERAAARAARLRAVRRSWGRS